MTNDDLYQLAEKARKAAMKKAYEDVNVWRDQATLFVTGSLKFLCVHIGLMLALMSVGAPQATAGSLALGVTGLLVLYNPNKFFMRVLFIEIGEDAFDEVVRQHRGEG